jgi:hypothetical protein
LRPLSWLGTTIFSEGEMYTLLDNEAENFQKSPRLVDERIDEKKRFPALVLNNYTIDKSDKDTRCVVFQRVFDLRS